MCGQIHCFVIGCKHEVKTFEPRPFCFVHGEMAKAIMAMNQQYFEAPKDKKQLDFCLSLSDQDFILSHLDGCNCQQLSLYLTGNDTSSFATNVKKGRIKAIKKTEIKNGIPITYYLISVSEIIRIIDLWRNWVTVGSVAKKIKESSATLFSYAIKSKFGPIRHNISGRLCIHKDRAVNLKHTKNICQQEKEKSKLISAQNNRCSLKKGEICAKDLSVLIGVPDYLVGMWIKKGYLKAEKRKRIYVISRENVIQFLVLIRSGQVSIWHRNREKILASGILRKMA